MLRERDFQWYWISGAADQIGSHSSALVIPILVLSAGGSPAIAGLLGTVAIGCETLLAPVAGVLADRWSRRRMMIASASVACGGAGVLTVAVASGAASLGLLFAVTVTESCAAAVYAAAARGSIRRVLPAADLRGAIAALRARDQGAALIGPALGGLLHQLARWAPLAANTVSYVVAVLCVRAIRTDLSADATTAMTVPSWRAAAVDGARFVWRQPFLRFAVVWAAGINAVFTAVYYFVLFVARLDGTGTASLGLMLSLASGCGLVGALLTPWVLRRAAPRVLVVACSWAMVALVAPLGTVRTVWAYGVLLGLVFLTGPVLSVLFQSTAIALIPDELQGRAGGLLAGAVGAVQFAAPVTAGVLVDRFSPAAVGLIFAAALAVLAGYATCMRMPGAPAAGAPVPTGAGADRKG